LVSTPRAYGWPWDVAAVTGAGYGDLDLDTAERVLGDDADVESWTALGLLNELSLNGQPMMSVIGFDRASDVDLPVLDGALPRGVDQVAIGAAVARAMNLAVGDAVDLGGAFAGRRATVSGIVVFPTLGPFMADRVGAGTGLLVSETAFEDVRGPYANADVRDLATFVGVKLRDGTRHVATVERVRAGLATLDKYDSPVFDYPTPVRPPSIIDTRSTRVVAVTVGIAFAAVTTIGLMSNAWSSSRGRRRELSVLRALGCRNSEVRRSVYVQSVGTMAGALVLGVPLGVIVGRLLWRGFADELGVVPDPASPWPAVFATVAGGLAVAVMAAWIPARFATRSSPATSLSAE
ncbi:MAG TPA: FtsX-like permease family protein, partial [Acidimicrobiia bacterium]|nr:FtsX-like permease family protein [Acidimicrobiia bacterium]